MSTATVYCGCNAISSAFKLAKCFNIGFILTFMIFFLTHNTFATIITKDTPVEEMIDLRHGFLLLRCGLATVMTFISLNCLYYSLKMPLEQTITLTQIIAEHLLLELIMGRLLKLSQKTHPSTEIAKESMTKSMKIRVRYFARGAFGILFITVVTLVALNVFEPRPLVPPIDGYNLIIWNVRVYEYHFHQFAVLQALHSGLSTFTNLGGAVLGYLKARRTARVAVRRHESCWGQARLLLGFAGA